MVLLGGLILSNLKHLRLCKLSLNEKNGAALAQNINSFGQLGLFYFNDDLSRGHPELNIKLDLNLPTSFTIENVHGIRTVILDTPRLQNVKVFRCSDYELDIVHADSVERLLTDQMEGTKVKN